VSGRGVLKAPSASPAAPVARDRDPRQALPSPIARKHATISVSLFMRTGIVAAGTAVAASVGRTELLRLGIGCNHPAMIVVHPAAHPQE
jgi:hypothetical protein